MEFQVVIDDGNMTPEEREEFCEQLRNFVNGEWWSQFSGTVIGPYEPPPYEPPAWVNTPSSDEGGTA